MICIIATLALCWQSSAQNNSPEALLEKCRENCVSLDYSFSVRGDLPVTGSGNALIQGESFRTSGNGMSVYCDGKTRWTVDENAKEVYIENVAPGEDAGNVIRGYLVDIVDYSCGKDWIKGCVKRENHVIDVSLTGISISEADGDRDRFRLDTGKLDPAVWIINDLR